MAGLLESANLLIKDQYMKEKAKKLVYSATVVKMPQGLLDLPLFMLVTS